jgi:GT2 family glycosyltransferase
VVTRGWAGALAAHFLREPRLGILGPVTNNIGNEARIDLRFGTIEEMHEAARAYTEARRGRRFPLRTAAFFCAMVPRAVWERVGELDEGFEVGFFEDDDYAMRLRAAGYEVACAEDTFVWHRLSASFDALAEARRREIFERNRKRFEAKWGKKKGTGTDSGREEGR